MEYENLQDVVDSLEDLNSTANNYEYFKDSARAITDFLEELPQIIEYLQTMNGGTGEQEG